MNKSAIRRRGLKKVKNYPVIDVYHPDAFLFTWTGGDISISSSNTGRNKVTKVILDDVTYTGSDMNAVLTNSGSLTIMPIEKSGKHECYMYVNDASGYAQQLSFYRIDWPTFDLRYPRKYVYSYHTAYKWNDIIFTGNYIKYIDNSWYDIRLNKVYIPYNLEVNEDNKFYKDKYVRVKYKFIEDE